MVPVGFGAADVADLREASCLSWGEASSAKVVRTWGARKAHVTEEGRRGDGGGVRRKNGWEIGENTRFFLGIAKGKR